MATFYSDIGTKQNATSLGGNQVSAAILNREIKYFSPTYTMVGTEAANDVIRLGFLKEGAEIVPHLCTVNSDAVATTATITVGDLDLAGVGAAIDADRYSTALDVAAAGNDTFTGGVAFTTPYRLGGEAWISFTFATMNTPVAGKKLRFRIAYVSP
jgi:hypothetical protein